MSLEGWMARHALDNSATNAGNRIAVFKVSTAWDVAGDASEHAATMVRRRSGCAWQSESGGHRIRRSPSKKKPLDEGLIGKAWARGHRRPESGCERQHRPLGLPVTLERPCRRRDMAARDACFSWAGKSDAETRLTSRRSAAPGRRLPCGVPDRDRRDRQAPRTGSV